MASKACRVSHPVCLRVWTALHACHCILGGSNGWHVRRPTKAISEGHQDLDQRTIRTLSLLVAGIFGIQQRLEEQKRRQEEDKKTRDAMQRKVFELVWSLPSIEMMEDVLEGVKSQMRQRQSACEEQDESAIEDEDDEDADGDWDM